MRVGIPRGYFYYDYFRFIQEVFNDDNIELIFGRQNDYGVYIQGAANTVDEACLPTKLFVGQIAQLTECCDYVVLPRIMKDYQGLYLCPKLLGLPELCSKIADKEKIIVTEQLYFNNKKMLKKAMWHICRRVGISRRKFLCNFEAGYSIQRMFEIGVNRPHIEASWELSPYAPAKGEIILPNVRTVFLAGHSYNVFDKYANGNVMKKLDDLGIGYVTEKEFLRGEKEEGLLKASLIKKPYWESMARILGAVLYAADNVDGIVYLSSFSCGQDSIIIELIREHTGGIPLMVLKLDEHQWDTGVDTRLEAFADLLERRAAGEYNIS